MKKLGLLFLILSCFFLSNVVGEEIIVNNLRDFESEISNASPGDTIVLENGVYDVSEGPIYVSYISGEESSPIVIKSESVLGVEITGEYSFYVKNSSYVEINGFKITQKVKSNCFKIESSNNIRVTNCYFDPHEDGSKSYWLYVTGESKYIRIDHNEFNTKYDEGCFIVVYGPSDGISQYVTIDHNYFKGHYFTGSNGGEAIRYGDSKRQNYPSHAIIEHNLFEECNGDPEVISVKSTNLTVRWNTLRECNGSIVLRHGDSCNVYGNFIMNGHGGIRFYGDNQKIIGNYIFDCDDIGRDGSQSDVLAAIAIGAGDKDDLENGQNTYDRPEDCIVAYNTLYVNKGKNIAVGVLGSTSYPPKNVQVINNVVVSNNNKCLEILKNPINLTFCSNIFYGSASHGDIDTGFTWVDPMGVLDEMGVYHVKEGSPVIDNAVTVDGLSFYNIDIDGQYRDDSYDIGADEFSDTPVVIRPLMPWDVGPQKEKICRSVEDILNALKNASPGDKILVEPGEYISDGFNSGHEEAYYYSNIDGLEDKPIIFACTDPDTYAVLKGANIEERNVLYITGDYWHISGLDISSGLRGVVLDNANNVILENLKVHDVGQEGIHIRDGSSFDIVRNCRIYDTGLKIPGYGEGIYVGSAVNHWDEFDERHYFVLISNCIIGPGVTAEHVDIKEGTWGTIVENCTFYGEGITGENYGDSFMDVKGNCSIIKGNVGYSQNNSIIEDAFQVHLKESVWGRNNIFYGNTLYLDFPEQYVVDVSSGASAVVKDNVRIPPGNMYKGNYEEVDELSPIVTIASPEDESVFDPGTQIEVEALAYDADGSIDKVEFFVDGEKIAVDYYPPYEAKIESMPAKEIKLWAVATDNNSNVSVSDTVLIMCSTIFKIPIQNIVDIDTDENNERDAVDGDYETYWSVYGENGWLWIKFDDIYEVDYMKIYFYKGDEREYYFSIYSSLDGFNWELIKKDTSDKKEGFQTFDLPNTNAMYFKYVGNGNSVNLFNSIVEIEIWGKRVEADIENEDGAIARDVILKQNFPNPFNSITNIKYYIPNKSEVKLQLYNLKGELVKTMVNCVQEQGEYHIRLDGESLSSGIYLCRLIAGDEIKTIKIVLIK